MTYYKIECHKCNRLKITKNCSRKEGNKIALKHIEDEEHKQHEIKNTYNGIHIF